MVLVANYHAPQETDLEKAIETLRKFGVEYIKLQKDVFNPDVYLKLSTIAKFGDLSRMTQYTSSKDEDKTAQLLTYPVLMTHDVIGYSEIIVGVDQEQHIQYARKLIKSFNSKFNLEYQIPTANIVIGRIKDLRKSGNKMSKSHPEGCLFLDDSPEDIRFKLQKAVCDELGLENLRFLYNHFVKEEIPYSNKNLKDKLADVLISLFQ